MSKKPKEVSTKQESYNCITNVMKNDCYRSIMGHLTKGALSRSQLSVATGQKLSTICARVAELKDIGLVHEKAGPEGKIYDKETDRNVKLVFISYASPREAMVALLKEEKQ